MAGIPGVHKTLNAGNYLGHNDWRFPNRNELVSLTSELILDSNQTNRPDWLGKQGFSNVQPNYWSSTTRPDSTSTAMMIHIPDGTTTYSMNKTLDWYLSVWPVRTGQAAGSVKLPKTGQTSCYNSSGAVIACSGTGQMAISAERRSMAFRTLYGQQRRNANR